MKNALYYLNMFRDMVLNDILNAPTDEAVIDYLSDCLKESYETVVETLNSEKQ